MNAPEAIFTIQLTEACSSIKSMINLLKGGNLVVLSHNGLIQVLWVKADMKGTISLVGISLGRHPFGRLEARHYHPLSGHVIKGVLYLLLVLYGYLPLGMLDWSYVMVSPDGVSAGHVANCVK